MPIFTHIVDRQNLASMALALCQWHHCAKEGQRQSLAHKRDSIQQRRREGTLKALEVWLTSHHAVLALEGSFNSWRLSTIRGHGQASLLCKERPFQKHRPSQDQMRASVSAT